MVDPIVTPPHPPVVTPEPLPPTVALNPPMVGVASPFLRVDGQNRDLILEAIRAWARGPLFKWADGWQKDLIKWLKDTEGWLDSWNEEVIRYVQDVLNAVINNSIELQDPVMAGIIEDLPSQTRSALDFLYMRRGGLDVYAGDYVTADNVTDDGPALNAMFNAIPEGSRVTFPDSQILINTTVRLPKPVDIVGGDIRALHSGPAFWVRSGDTSIEGTRIEGKGTSLYDGNAAHIRANGTIDARFLNLRFKDLTLIGSAGSGIRIEYAQGVEVDNVFIDGFTYMGVQLLSVTDATVDRVAVRGVVHQPNLANSYGISMSDNLNTDAARCRNISVSRCNVDGMRDWVGIETHGGYNIRIHDNTVNNCASGIAMVSGGASRLLPAHRANVQNNLILFGSANVQRGGLRLQGLVGAPATGIMTLNTILGYTQPTIFTEYNEAQSIVTGNVSD